MKLLAELLAGAAAAVEREREIAERAHGNGKVDPRRLTRTMERMAVTAHAKLDVQRIRADFPYLEELSNGKPVAFLDSAASTQKPRQVLDAMHDFY